MTHQEVLNEAEVHLARAKELQKLRLESIERCELVSKDLLRIVPVHKPVSVLPC